MTRQPQGYRRHQVGRMLRLLAYGYDRRRDGVHRGERSGAFGPTD